MLASYPKISEAGAGVYLDLTGHCHMTEVSLPPFCNTITVVLLLLPCMALSWTLFLPKIGQASHVAMACCWLTYICCVLAGLNVSDAYTTHSSIGPHIRGGSTPFLSWVVLCSWCSCCYCVPLWGVQGVLHTNDMSKPVLRHGCSALLCDPLFRDC
jgi:hypothetical protein